MKPIRVEGKVGDKSIVRFISKQTASAPEQINTLMADIRKEFERQGYDTTTIKFKISEVV